MHYLNFDFVYCFFIIFLFDKFYHIDYYYFENKELIYFLDDILIEIIYFTFYF